MDRLQTAGSTGTHQYNSPCNRDAIAEHACALTSLILCWLGDWGGHPRRDYGSEDYQNKTAVTNPL
jgi:hypothetical protein